MTSSHTHMPCSTPLHPTADAAGRSLFFDIDGTLVSFETHAIPASALRALEQAKVNGARIFICTGRPRSILDAVAPIRHLIDGYITFNGALCFVGEEVVACHPIPRAEVDWLLADADRAGYPCIVAGEHRMVVHGNRPIVHDVFKGEINVDLDYDTPVAEVLASERILQLSPFIPADYESSAVMPAMRSCLSGRWHPSFTDIISNATDKGRGMLAMVSHLGLDPALTISFGDGGNDASLLRTAGIGVAMGNGVDAAKAAADYVTSAVEADGVEQALRHFGVI